MDKKSSDPRSIDEYIAQYPEELQEKLQELRSVIRAAAPEATESISYKMPAFQFHGSLVYFGVFKHHIGFYPTASGIRAFRAQLAGYKSSAGAVQFPIDQPLPLDLVAEIVAFRVQENDTKHKQKIKNLPN